MPVSRNSSSNLRYFLAGLKPLGRVTVWAPLGILALVGLGLWQYRNQTNPLTPSPLGEGKSSPETQWIGKEVPAPALKPQIIDPDTGLPPSGPLESSSNPNPSNPEQTSPDPNLSPNSPLNPNAGSANNISPDANIAPNSSLNPLNQTPLQRQPNTFNPQLQNKTQTLFPPLLPRGSTPNTGLPANNSSPRAPSAAGGSVPRSPFASGYNPPSQTESPLQRAVNRATAQPNYPQPASVQNTILPPAQTAPQPSLYSNSYQPPSYQPPGVNNGNVGGNSYGGNNNNNGGRAANSPSQPPAPSGGGFQSGF